MTNWASRLGSLTLALLLNLAVAQTSEPSTAVLPAVSAPATEEQVCAAEEGLFEVHIATTTRGTFLTRRVGEDIWLDQRAFRPEESAYFDAQVHCGPDHYVRLLPSLSARIDTEQLTLTFEPAPQALAGHSLTVVEPAQSPAASTSLFSFDYAASVSTGLNTNLLALGAIRAKYLNGPLSAFVGSAASFSAGNFRWVPSAQVALAFSPNASVALVYNAPTTWSTGLSGFSSLSTSQFTGARLNLSNTSLRHWPVLKVDLPFQAHLRIRVDGLLITEYDVAAGPVTLRDLPLHHSQGRIEVEIRDETGTRTVVQDYSFPGASTPGSYDLALDAGLLDRTSYFNVSGRYTLTEQVDLEGSGRVIGSAVQGHLGARIVPDPSKSFSIGMNYNSRLTQPFRVVGSARWVAAPFTVSAYALMPSLDLRQMQFGTTATFTSPRYDLLWTIARDNPAAGLTSTVRGNVRVSSGLTLSPALTVRRDALRVGLALDYHPDAALTVRSSAVAGNGGATASVNAQYQVNPTTQLGLSATTGGAGLALHYADQVRVDAALNTSGQVNAAVQGSAYFVPGGLQLSQGTVYPAFVTLETGLSSVRVFADGQFKGTTDASGHLVFSVTPGRAVTVRIDEDSLPFDVTLGSGSEVLNIPGPGSYRLDWRSNFVHSRFVSFRWADGTPVTNAEIRFENGELSYTDRLGTGYLVVSSQDRRATLTSEDGQHSCVLNVPAKAEVVVCEQVSP